MTIVRSTSLYASALLVALPLGLVACGGGEEPSDRGGAAPASAPTEENVPGTYRMSGSDEYVLESDGTFTHGENGEVYARGTWAIEGDSLVFTYPDGDANEGIASGETRRVGFDGRAIVVEPDAEYPLRYPRR